MTDALKEMIACGQALSPLSIERGWWEVDTLKDLQILEEDLMVPHGQ